MIQLKDNYGEIFPREFAIDLNSIPINYWNCICYDQEYDIWIEGIPGPVWLDITTIKEQCLSNVTNGDGLQFGEDKYTYYTQFVCKDQIYHIGLTGYISKGEFREIFEYIDKLMVRYDGNMLCL